MTAITIETEVRSQTSQVPEARNIHRDNRLQHSFPTRRSSDLEGKGKIVDLLAERFDIVVRYQGGHNAGHSVQVGNDSFVLHLLPSGIVHEGKTCVLGNGMARMRVSLGDSDAVRFFVREALSDC